MSGPRLAAGNHLPHKAAELLSSHAVAAVLAARIREKTPTALLRYGDTSGRLIARPAPEAADFQYLRRFLGQDITPERVDWLASKIESSVEQADIIGLRSDLLGPPFPRQILADDTADLLNNLVTLYPIREVEKSALKRDCAKRLSETRIAMEDMIFPKSCLFTDAWIHIGLLEVGFFSALFKEPSRLTLCTSSVRSNSIQILQEALGNRLQVFECPAYPWEESQFGRTTDTLWQRWQETITSLVPQQRGEILLIAAGIWTKVIAGKWKQQGGIAIDIGSVMDYLELAPTRPAVLATRYDTPQQVPTHFSVTAQLNNPADLDSFIQNQSMTH